ncbi:MAG: FAD-dependent oxidoreductase [Burkholderiaceae bacterium]|jgi:NADPH-dependent 2,4-dienoyl-CoA reductase/sulfur reductase-like enzyme/rhodanese-related sulfurtransferase|nr:FAD-dependent oxidoreductase [Burkholderiaceae bacterium]
MKVVIVGGVAGGASCAARLRRLDEQAEIVMVERGPYVSYANCGLPYHVGGVIADESSLLVATAPMFRAVFNVDARTGCEAISISPKHKTVELRDVATGAVTTESYDKLVLAPGAAPIRPPLPGIDLPGVFSVRTVPDARTIRQWLHRGEEVKTGMDSYTGFQVVTKPKRAVVVGGGFIGLEMVENLAHLGLDVTLIEKLDQVMPPLDPEMARLVERYLVKHGVNLQLADGVAGFRQVAHDRAFHCACGPGDISGEMLNVTSGEGSLEVLTESGQAYAADIVILAIGVRPETALAKAAGLEIGQRGGIRVDEHMCTSDPDILAVGDAVEVKDVVTGQWTLIPLAGPANRQGRIAADVIAGRDSRYRGTQGTSICKIFEGEIGQTGPSEKVLKQAGVNDFEKVYVYQNSHAGYYPGAKMMAIKVLFRKTDGRLLGAQLLSEEGVAKRVDAFAMAIQMGATVHDLEESELCYAPPFGSAKDPVNFAGMVAGNLLRGDMPIVHWEGTGQGFLLDVRNPPELEVESVPGALNIPLPQLRARLDELPRDQEIQVICRSAVRAYYATRILVQNGFTVRNISGGMLARSHRA